MGKGMAGAVWVGLLLFCVLGTASATGQAAGGQKAPESRLERIEWTWTDHSDTLDPKLPNVLFIGDSITRGYFPAVAKRLAGVANAYLYATSCSSGDPRLVVQLHTYFETGPKFSVIQFNNGMHGWDYSEEEYAAGLPAMVRVLREEHPESALIWATTTPVAVVNGIGGKNSRIDARNASALKLMKEERIPVDDQHELMLHHQDLYLDGGHFNDAGAAVQADQASALIRAILESAKKKAS
jgi:lysophospholipase L1-like esterase